MDKNGVFYFVSTRSYKETLSTIYQGRFSGGSVTGVKIVDGVSEKALGRVNFDVEVSADGGPFISSTGFLAESPRRTRRTSPSRFATAQASGVCREAPSFSKTSTLTRWNMPPAFRPDDLELFFTRAGKRAGDLPLNQKERHATFDSPARVAAIKGFVEAPTLSPDGRSFTTI